MNRSKLIICISVIVVICLTVYAPNFLVKSDNPEKSDAIVLFIGPDFVPRKQEALRLLRDGYARYLIIPEYGAFLETPVSDVPLLTKSVTNSSGYPKYYERTHVEVLEAKATMDRAGIKSAIFVSSPYQMRRIDIMALKVLNRKDYTIKCVPSRYVDYGGILWMLKRKDLIPVFSEYVKIIWYMAYAVVSKDC